MKKILSLLMIGSVMTGCASFEKWSEYEDQQAAEKIAELNAKTEQEDALEQSAISASKSFQNEYRTRFANQQITGSNGIGASQNDDKGINYYVRGLMQDLVSNLQYVSSKTPMAVTSFVFLDGSYEHADLVGKQVSESFIHEVHKYGIPVVDFKSTDYLRVSPNGDFVLSQDFLDLDGNLPIKYVITGTMVKHVSGYLINARVIGLKSKAVVGTAQGFLPSKVVKSLISSDINNGVPLMTGTN
mgnify:CR=1 FL=1